MMRALGRWLARHDIAALRAQLDEALWEASLHQPLVVEETNAAHWRRRAVIAEAANRRYDQILAEQRANDPEHRLVVGSGPVWGGDG